MDQTEPRHNDLSHLPIGWVWTKVGEICDLINGHAFKPNEWSSQGLPIIRIQNLNNLNTDFNYCNFDVEEKFLVNNGQLLFAWSGTPGTSFGAHIWNRGKAVLNQHIFKVEINESCINKIFFMHLINRNIAEYIKKAHGTAGLAHITKNKFENSLIPLPPLAEQRRIVGKIEELFTKLDAGVSALQKTQAQLKRYRQSVLKAACEGKLVPTEAELARAEGRAYEPADVMLARITKERRAAHESKGAKYKEPAAPDMSGLPKLPEGWGWATLEQLSWDSGYGTSEKCDYNFLGPPVLRIPNISEGKIVLNDLKFASESTNLNDSESLKYGDMLVIRTNGSKDLIGRAGVVNQDFSKPHFFASYLIRFRIIELGGLPIWLSSIWHTLRIRSWIERVAATSAGQYNISMSTLNKLPLELPPLAEQHRIVAEVERRLSVADEVARTIEQSLAQAARLRQSILKKAFEGKLVAQNPEDEPANVLLEKIRLQKQLKIKKSRRKR